MALGGARSTLAFHSYEPGFPVVLSEENWARYKTHLDVHGRLICTGSPAVKVRMTSPDLV